MFRETLRKGPNKKGGRGGGGIWNWGVKTSFCSNFLAKTVHML